MMEATFSTSATPAVQRPVRDFFADAPIARPSPTEHPPSPGHGPVKRPVRYDVSASYSPPCAADGELRRSPGIAIATLSTPLLMPIRSESTDSFLLCAQNAGTRPLRTAMRIGRDQDNDWVIADSHASRHHVSLHPQGDWVRVRDLGSRNGTFINGVRIVDGQLRLGGRLIVGQTEFRLALPHEDRSTDELIGTSEAMQQVRQQVRRFAGSGLTVLILGESGTGKELVARALHRHSGRPGPLVTVNCGALPRELIESELFGHERGAFTGAQKRHLGCFGEAHGGTLFLDEVGELPLELQPRLLRALENRRIRPVGATREVDVDVRIVAATHRNLERAVQEGRFRADLYYRLCGLEIDIPPLRERRQDIPLLLRHFLQHAEQEGLPVPQPMRDEDLAKIVNDPWPGNVRELRAALLRAVHLGGPQLSAAAILPASRRTPRPGAGPSLSAQRPAPVQSTDDTPPAVTSSLCFAEIERQTLLRALTQAGGSGRRAAELLGLPKSTVHDKLRRLGIPTGRAIKESAGRTASAERT